MAKNENRQLKTFYCDECKEENYRLELNKYCPRCQKHTKHKEKK